MIYTKYVLYVVKIKCQIVRKSWSTARKIAHRSPPAPLISKHLACKMPKTSRWRAISMQCYCTSGIKPMRVASRPTQSQGFAARNCEPAIYLKSYFMAFISSNSGKNKKYTISLPMENTIFHFTPQLKQNCN